MRRIFKEEKLLFERIAITPFPLPRFLPPSPDMKPPGEGKYAKNRMGEQRTPAHPVFCDTLQISNPAKRRDQPLSWSCAPLGRYFTFGSILSDGDNI
jgi:hypothetical protein